MAAETAGRWAAKAEMTVEMWVGEWGVTSELKVEMLVEMLVVLSADARVVYLVETRVVESVDCLAVDWAAQSENPNYQGNVWHFHVNYWGCSKHHHHGI